MSRLMGRLQAVEQERDRLAALLEQRLAAINSAAETQRDLAAARGQIVDLSREIERLRHQLENARREQRRLQGLLARRRQRAATPSTWTPPNAAAEVGAGGHVSSRRLPAGAMRPTPSTSPSPR